MNDMTVEEREEKERMVSRSTKSQIVANHRKPSQTIANGRKRSQTVANDRKWSQTTANGRKRSQMVASHRKQSQMVANEVLIRTECLLARTGDAGPTFNRHWVGVGLQSPPDQLLFQANTKHLYNICTTPAQRLRRIVQMVYKCFVFPGLNAAQQTRGVEPVLV